MKKIITLSMIVCIALASVKLSYAQSDDQTPPPDDSTATADPLEKFLDDNPKAVEVRILSEGTNAYLCANDTALFVRLSVGNPMIFMRMLMQGMKINIDPTGYNKKKYAVLFPSAHDVEEYVGDKSNSNGRPDIGPLVMAMNSVGASYDVNTKDGRRYKIPSLIELDTENECLHFYALVPKKELLEDKKLATDWSLGIYIESPIGVLEGPVGGGQMEPQRPPMPMQGGRADTSAHQESFNVEKFMRKKIDSWAKFSIDEVNSINF